MKIGIQTWGSNGDIRPLLALAQGLQKAGHSVTLAVSSIDNKDYTDICADLNIDYLQIPRHMDFDIEGFARRTFRMNTLTWIRALLKEALFPYEQAIYETAKQLVHDNDCVIGHHFLYPLKPAAIRRGKPYISVTFCHAALPSATQAPFHFPDLGVFLNKLSWKLLDYLFNRALKKPMMRLWLAEGEAPVENILTELLTSQKLNLVAVDELFCPHHKEWKPNNLVCGFLNLTEDAQHWPIPQPVQAFLEQGERPVYMTFGSLQQAAPEWSMELFIEAARSTGCRAIIQTSSADYPADSRQDSLYFIGKHPHQPLFRHCAAIVYHGGAGTTHAATLGGCPSIVVPFIDEQLFWAHQLQTLGLAFKPLPARKVNARSLAKAIQKVLDSETLSNNAKSYSRKIQRHNGVAEAVRLIENQFSAESCLI
ncbi:MAG: glycosyltransferase [Methylococcales bacterium]|nr:glycosyltransferase [Methylococcales bacterium]